MLLLGVDRVDANTQIVGAGRKRDFSDLALGLCRYGGTARDRDDPA